MADIYISLGSNIEREYHVKHGLEALAITFNIPFAQLSLSSLFESEAIGFSGNAFYNMVIGIKTHDSVEQVASKLRNIEIDYGRTHDAKKFSPRTLDLDLLLYDDLIIDTPAQLPREEIDKNAFVLWPLSEIAPTLIHPLLKLSYQTLWQNYNKTSQHLKIVKNCW
ncbi:2-amino-4-hydroxy-6-hydroxymethyldihydropteridine diphosphokinase [Colwellia sp. 4_MG-2023]|jgi:2-amino-4-hydroxy-6-hydroxymethyldihydropteridine diphosphokinase|uniref:2-amino-4-hydroxy-6- hydroxymethyldihydropteridine diphosphokinase n=1 Tax=unclassified Colwellia TaxID=196834 RepID=UPI001C0A16F2|nr:MULTISPECIES: 2-amino-4-hydroxy-6-hydroxymethyldihydropteridine diphosphokinase [unclassified Colwellia]MBU2926260.1 2-amino-4-hydroxy-6-hydroxymethyldihydropteridine diphosphokinase [Colwellia sp. C2M11]MDO6489429.1 2-amino-4-hydroxy-6-hydroxymethyldihydropteridine diphosphokinase [Colwellia sp. 6_MG-2023]MDO6508507.1 2-amino-4-hydroxy-6-hydroxymethyldihydropteridine diphosphokinase [Colwellia sp. 5_MG-2023]MDO6557122.1 2-amino-4-hydroxy-6-hydroxymethyldihydropteridine diphosphokinase [Colw